MRLPWRKPKSAPVVELVMRDGRLWVAYKDAGCWLIIRDYDEHPEGARDVYEPAEAITQDKPY